METRFWNDAINICNEKGVIVIGKLQLCINLFVKYKYSTIKSTNYYPKYPTLLTLQYYTPILAILSLGYNFYPNVSSSPKRESSAIL